MVIELKAFSIKIRDMIFKRDYPISSIFSNTVYRRLSISFLVFGIIAIIYIVFWYGMVIYLKNTIEGLRDYMWNIKGKVDISEEVKAYFDENGYDFSEDEDDWDDEDW